MAVTLITSQTELAAMSPSSCKTCPYQYCDERDYDDAVRNQLSVAAPHTGMLAVAEAIVTIFLVLSLTLIGCSFLHDLPADELFKVGS